MAVRVIGIGQPAAGDDGVGLLVLDALRERALPAATELYSVREASAVLPLLETAAEIVFVDAAIDAGAPGSVVVASLDEVDGEAPSGVSTHGLGLAQAVELSRTLNPDTTSKRVQFVAIAIERPQQYGLGLSEQARSAVPKAVEAIVKIIMAEESTTNA